MKAKHPEYYRLRKYVKHRLVSGQIFAARDVEKAQAEGRRWANEDGDNTYSITEVKRSPLLNRLPLLK